MTSTTCTCGSGRQAQRNIFSGVMDCLDCRGAVGTATVGAGKRVDLDGSLAWAAAHGEEAAAAYRAEIERDLQLAARRGS